MDLSKMERRRRALAELVLARDQVGASQVFYDLIEVARPLTEIVGEMVRIHAPYTHVPYHQHLDDGIDAR